MDNHENKASRIGLKNILSIIFETYNYTFIMVSALFILATFVGYFYFNVNYDSAMYIISRLVEEKFESLGQTMEGMHVIGRIGVIFWNNLIVVLISMASGIFLGVFPLVIIFANGLFVGLFTGFIEMEGFNILKFLVIGVLPHGIFEIPAVIIAAAVGVKMGITFAFSPDYPDTVKRFKAIIRLFLAGLLIALPLLAIAAVIEMTLTPFLVREILGKGTI